MLDLADLASLLVEHGSLGLDEADLSTLPVANGSIVVDEANHFAAKIQHAAPFLKCATTRHDSGTSNVRSAALRALESVDSLRFDDRFRSAAIDVVERDDSDETARVAAVTGRADYMSAYLKAMRDPERGHLEWTPDERHAFADAQALARAMSIGSNPGGGFLVPFMLDPSIVITGAGTINPIRDMATVKTAVASTWRGVTAGQISASWDAEASAVSDDAPTLTQPSIPVNLARAFIPVSFEAFDDISNLAAEIAALFADAKDRLEAAGFVTGDGTNQAPKGVSFAVGAVTASRVSPTTAGTLGLADLYAVQNALPARFSRSARWGASLTVINRIRRFGEGTTGSNSAFWSDLGSGQPPQLLGRDIEELSSMSSTVTTGQDVLLYGDFSRYYIVDYVGGARSEFIPNLFDPSTGRPTSQRGFLLWWRAGADVIDTNAFRQLRL